MHATEREDVILRLLATRGFVSFQDLEKQLAGSPATIRRDLERLAQEEKLVRVRGGAKASPDSERGRLTTQHRLSGVPFSENIKRHIAEKQAIAEAAVSYLSAGEGVVIDGGTTTFQLCPHLAGLDLQVLTNSLHIVAELLNQAGTRILVPSGSVFREQSIILPAFGEDGMPDFHGQKLFMGAGAVGPQGLMQQDVILVASQRLLMRRAERVIVLADASKFVSPSGNVVCSLDEIDAIVTDDRVSDAAASMIESAGVSLLIAGSAAARPSRRRRGSGLRRRA